MGELSGTKSLTFYPFAYSLLDDELTNFCWYCLSDGNIKKCTGCKVAYFCNKQCLSKGWMDHKVECKSWAASVDGDTIFVPNVEIRMLGRIVTRYKAISEGNDTGKHFYLNRQSRRDIMELWAHENEMKNDAKAWKKFTELLQCLREFYGEKNLMDEETVFKLHCRNYINRHAISDTAYLKEIGKGLYLDLCAYDHSCKPNTIYACDGFVAHLKPLNGSVNVEDKSSTFYAYIDLLAHKEQRQKVLESTWYFHCKCKRCSDPAEHILTSVQCAKCSEPLMIFGSKSNRNSSTLSIACVKCLETCSKERVSEAISAMRFIDGVLERDEISQMDPKQARKFVEELLERFKDLLPKINIYLVKLIQTIIPLCDPTDSKTLLDYHLAASDCMEVCFPQNHPALAYHFMNIGIFYCKLNQRSSGIEYLTKAKNMIEFVLGTEHPMLIQINEHIGHSDS